MPKSRHRSRSKHRSRRYDSEVSSRRNDREVRSSDESSKDPRETSRDELSHTLKEILAFIKDQRDSGGQARTSLWDDSGEPSTLESQDSRRSLDGQSETPQPVVTFQTDKQTVLENRGVEPGMFLRSVIEET